MIPFVVGAAFLSETVKFWYILATILLTIALVLPIFDKSEHRSKGKKIFWVFLLLCGILFALNGANSTIGKLHQIGENIVDTVDFLVWKYIFKIVYCGILFFAHRRKGKYKMLVGKNSLLMGTGFAIVHIVATLLQLYCAIRVNASLMYPLVTGGALMFTPILSWMIFKEKMNVFVLVGIFLSVAATVLFAF